MKTEDATTAPVDAVVITTGKPRRGYNWVDAYADGLRFGFVVVETGRYGIEDCICGYRPSENPSPSVCPKCGWNPKLS